jgi:hypothetical protein
MLREGEEGKTWASVVAVLAILSTIGVLYAPLLIR